MKKIITLLLSVILVTSFSVTVFAVEESSSSSESQIPSSSSQSSSISSEQESSSEAPSSSETVSSDTEITPVKPTLQIIQIPKKTVYELGESLDLTGLKVSITSDEGIFISNNGTDLTSSVTKFNKEGKQTVQLKYKDVTASFEVTVNPKHVHKYGSWSIEKEASCQKEGTKVRECECGNAETVAILPLGHDWNEGTILKEATTKGEGLIKYTCTRCGTEKADKTPMIKKEKIKIKINFKFELKWWMVFLPIGLTVAFYIWALKKIFKKKA